MGVVLLLAGIAALNRVRMEIPLEKENQEKLVKFMIRIGVFSVLYLVPLLIVLACYLYESSYRAIWETTWVQEKCRDYHIPCPYQVTSKKMSAVGPVLYLHAEVLIRYHLLCYCFIMQYIMSVFMYPKMDSYKAVKTYEHSFLLKVTGILTHWQLAQMLCHSKCPSGMSERKLEHRAGGNSWVRAAQCQMCLNTETSEGRILGGCVS